MTVGAPVRPTAPATMTPLEACKYAERYANKRVLRSWDHGPGHWRAVARIGRVISLAAPGVDPLVVLLFAAFHDTRRENETRDPEHGRRAAIRVDMLDRQGRLPLTAGQSALLTFALEHHDQKVVSDQPTVGACYDADRLCLVRYGMRIERAYLSTPVVRDNLPTFVRLAKDAQPWRGYDVGSWDRVAEEYGY